MNPAATPYNPAFYFNEPTPPPSRGRERHSSSPRTDVTILGDYNAFHTQFQDDPYSSTCSDTSHTSDTSFVSSQVSLAHQAQSLSRSVATPSSIVFPPDPLSQTPPPPRARLRGSRASSRHAGRSPNPAGLPAPLWQLRGYQIHAQPSPTD